MIEALLAHLHYWLSGALLLIGLYGMLVPTHLVRKLMGMNILQTAVIGFFLTIGAKSGAQLPLARTTDARLPLAKPRGAQAVAADHVNPLPHALMLTAIVVGVSITGVALALAIRIHRQYGTLHESELLAKLTE
jgi:multicomponent Na+:H+ antiporter subunit C